MKSVDCHDEGPAAGAPEDGMPQLFLNVLSDWVHRFSLADAPEPVVRVACRATADTIAVALAGSTTAVATATREWAREHAAAGRSTLLGSSGSAAWRADTLSAPAAAFVNATAAHALDFDDNCYAGFVHASAAIVPAALAVAQAIEADGAALIAAYIVGAECQFVTAQCLGRSIYDRGWWTTGVLGPIGACAAVCHLLRLPRDQTASALGLAVAGTGGTKTCFGTDAKMVLLGRASEAGVTAALLAQRGITGPAHGCDAPGGLAALFNEGKWDATPVATLGRQWRLLDPGIDTKRVPVCLSSHAAIDAMRELLDTGIAVADIETVICDVPSIVRKNLAYDVPTTRQQAQFSMPFAIAATSVLGDVTLAALTAFEAVGTETSTPQHADGQQGSFAVLDMMQRIAMQTSTRWRDATLVDSAPEGAWVRVTLRDGRTIEAFRAKARGAASSPLSDDAFAHKFIECAAHVMSAEDATRLLARLDRLEQQTALDTLFECPPR